MNNNKSNKSKNRIQTQTPLGPPKPEGKSIKLGIDVRLGRYRAVRILDGGTRRPPQRFEPAEFLLWVAKQLTLAVKRSNQDGA